MDIMERTIAALKELREYEEKAESSFTLHLTVLAVCAIVYALLAIAREIAYARRDLR